QPTVLASQAGASSGGADMPEPNQWQAWMLGWLWPAGLARPARPESPQRAKRTIPGTPFAPLTPPQVATPSGVVVLALASAASLGGADMTEPNQWQAWMLDWLWPAGQARDAGPESPQRAMRTILGTPFAPLTRSQVATQSGVVVLALAALALMVTTDLDHEKLRSVLSGGLAGGLGGGGMVLVGMYGWRLEQLRRRPAAEMTEFALLPGWGDAAQARRTLLLAAVRPMAHAALWATAVLAVL